jgi:hypothetical protein
MKKTYIALLAGSLGLLGGCDNFLDVNTNPNAPERVAANLYLPPMLHWLVSTPMFEGRVVGRYTQQWTLPTTTTTPTTWDRMGYDAGSDLGGEHWRTSYFVFGQNLIDMMEKAEAEQRWDVLGVGYVLKAWGWQSLTDNHGEIIIKEAFDRTKTTYAYDTQQFAYEEVRRLLEQAIANLQRTDGAVSATYLARGDKIYNGDREQWLRFAYGLLAMNLNHYTPNKSTYDPAAVIAAVNRSLRSNADDALLAFPATFPGANGDNNFYGPSRTNLTSYRQTQFVVSLMNGEVFTGAVDPRMSRMLAPAPDGQYRGLNPNVGNAFTSLPVAQRPNNFFGYPGTPAAGSPTRYLFDDKSRVPAMTYSQLQFVKAEAAYYMGNRALALEAYRNGISSHIDFVNARNQEAGQPTQITAAEKAAFLANPAVVPTAANLTLSHIMVQKYIAQWAWAHTELWMDMRRYHYTDVDPATGRQVYPGFTLPTSLFADNAGKPVYRLRPRFNSEYVWNRPGLDAIGGLDGDYHTDLLWIVQR